MATEDGEAGQKGRSASLTSDRLRMCPTSERAQQKEKIQEKHGANDDQTNNTQYRERHSRPQWPFGSREHKDWQRSCRRAGINERVNAMGSQVNRQQLARYQKRVEEESNAEKESGGGADQGSVWNQMVTERNHGQHHEPVDPQERISDSRPEQQD